MRCEDRSIATSDCRSRVDAAGVADDLGRHRPAADGQRLEKPRAPGEGARGARPNISAKRGRGGRVASGGAAHSSANCSSTNGLPRRFARHAHPTSSVSAESPGSRLPMSAGVRRLSSAPAGAQTIAAARAIQQRAKKRLVGDLFAPEAQHASASRAGSAAQQLLEQHRMLSASAHCRSSIQTTRSGRRRARRRGARARRRMRGAGCEGDRTARSAGRRARRPPPRPAAGQGTARSAPTGRPAASARPGSRGIDPR